VEQQTERAQSAAVGAAAIYLACGHPCLTCCPPIVSEPPRLPRGRPKGSGTYSTAELRQSVLAKAEELWRDEQVPTLRLVAPSVGYSTDSLSRALVARDLSWTAIRSDARRRSFGRFMSG
jgi:hypothetical protein